VTIRQDEESRLPPPRRPVEAVCAVCGVTVKTTADPDDDMQLRAVANSVMKRLCAKDVHRAA